MFLEKLEEGIYRFGYLGTLLNGVAIVRGQDFYLIDSGLSRTAPVLNRLLKRLSLDKSSLKAIAFTHAHADHVGGVKAFDDLEGVKLISHEEDAKYLEEGSPPPFASRLASLLAPKELPRLAKVVRLKDGDVVELGVAFQVVHAPGHTPGSVVYYSPELKLAVLGDAAANYLAPGFPPPFLCTDPEKAKKSLLKVLELDFEVAVFGHGPALKQGARRKMEALLKR